MPRGEQKHPCLHCGACCAYFRVSFYWREAERPDTKNPVPKTLTVEEDSLHRCMKGTEKKYRPRCQALKGEIGQAVACEIYSRRPSPCRKFEASFERGIKNERCDEARLAYGLKPLTRGDWPSRQAYNQILKAHSATIQKTAIEGLYRVNFEGTDPLQLHEIKDALAEAPGVKASEPNYLISFD